MNHNCTQRSLFVVSLHICCGTNSSKMWIRQQFLFRLYSCYQFPHPADGFSLLFTQNILHLFCYSSRIHVSFKTNHEWMRRRFVKNVQPMKYSYHRTKPFTTLSLSVGRITQTVNKQRDDSAYANDTDKTLTNAAFPIFNPHFYRFSLLCCFSGFSFFLFSSRANRFFVQIFISDFWAKLQCSHQTLHSKINGSTVRKLIERLIRIKRHWIPRKSES